mmetsp:Transcript_32802/g.112946  ORF Transcript_32802/g.112946 Transcript_32802/m.112946 type:complete len:215 (-) Transcript_32802:182-826(-)
MGRGQRPHVLPRPRHVRPHAGELPRGSLRRADEAPRQAAWPRARHARGPPQLLRPVRRVRGTAPQRRLRRIRATAQGPLGLHGTTVPTRRDEPDGVVVRHGEAAPRRELALAHDGRPAQVPPAADGIRLGRRRPEPTANCRASDGAVRRERAHARRFGGGHFKRSDVRRTDARIVPLLRRQPPAPPGRQVRLAALWPRGLRESRSRSRFPKRFR